MDQPTPAQVPEQFSAEVGAMAGAPASVDQSMGIFVSYTRRDDSTLVLQLRSALELAGYRVLGDWLLSTGDDWESGLDAMMHEADGVVVVVGSSALDSNSVMRETTTLLGRGLAERIPIVPLLHGGMLLGEIRSSGTRGPG
ncbi:toll/interleukin-1 receptor domain-containing protein [Amycolatopsis sp. NPDC059657]|uniref:toll/interleukin-1 receptor domain-containing protein n=1 Tax=Amycolatopsis sp. NPDC059657 TaxID=3346899 RepID=UPI00366B0237